jgi:hypothetical protein
MSDLSDKNKNAGSSSVAGWNELIASLSDLPDRMLAKLPDSMRANALIQQEVARLALEALISTSIDAIGGDGDHPAFLPALGQLLNVGQPNADTVYRTARITPGRSYRLRGKRGSLRLSSIGQVVPRNMETGAGRAYLDINKLAVDAEDRFDVLLSTTHPDGYTGDWWELRPAANKLMMRLVSCDWANEQSPTFSIEPVDQPVALPRRSAEDLEQRLRALPMAIDFIGLMFVDHVEKLRAEGYLNKLKMFDITNQGGLAGQFYYEGAYDINESEALIVEAEVPQKYGYYSLILTNEIYETIDWYNNHSSLNDKQALVDSDGILRIVISNRDPGVPNWLDVAGHLKGVIQGRWTDCSTQPIPSVRKVALVDVCSFLPARTATVTPEARERIVRERRAALQQRPLW